MRDIDAMLRTPLFTERVTMLRLRELIYQRHDDALLRRFSSRLILLLRAADYFHHTAEPLSASAADTLTLCYYAPICCAGYALRPLCLID